MRATTAVPSARSILSTIVAVATLTASASVLAQASPQLCGSLENAIGPFDYRVQRGHELKLVESAHFTTSVEMAMKGERGYLGQDLDYTLRAYPNHHRALLAIIRYEGRLNFIRPIDRIPRPAECYFERAVRWKPDDVVARMIYAQFLYGKSRPDVARGHLTAAKRLAADNPLTHYNIGLIYLEGKDFAEALGQAHRAIALGFDRTDLRDKLVAARRWIEPPAAAASSAASAASR